MRRSMQQQQKQQQMMMQMQMKAMQEAMARQAAYQKQVRESLAAASKTRQEKETQRLQNIMDRRKAEQSSKSSGDSKPASNDKP